MVGNSILEFLISRSWVS